jgi:hypothetical protein
MKLQVTVTVTVTTESEKVQVQPILPSASVVCDPKVGRLMHVAAGISETSCFGIEVSPSPLARVGEVVG